MGESVIPLADLRYAAAEAKFTTAFAQRGLIAEHGIAGLLAHAFAGRVPSGGLQPADEIDRKFPRD